MRERERVLKGRQRSCSGVVSDLLGHKKVNLAMDVYDRSNMKDFEQAPGQVMSTDLLPSCDPNARVQSEIVNGVVSWWARLDLNQEPTDYESAALTVELRARALNCGCGDSGIALYRVTKVVRLQIHPLSDQFLY
jgi:hypothetical protein